MMQPREYALVRPRPGMKCRRPPVEGGAMLRPEGESVQLTTYWRRRLAAGDVELCDPPRAEKKPVEAPIAIEEPTTTSRKRKE